jgi:hypothetical protein
MFKSWVMAQKVGFHKDAISIRAIRLKEQPTVNRSAQIV